MLTEKTTYGYKDVAIQPAIITNIKHRSDCNPFNKQNKLPIFVAPMTSVVDETNFSVFDEAGLIPILPRKGEANLQERISYAISGKWAAFSLDEAEDLFFVNLTKTLNQRDKDDASVVRILIDIANGHMNYLYTLVESIKQRFDTLNSKENECVCEIMVGNIANPSTILTCMRAGVDYVRCSIGTGDGCTTTTKTGIHYGIASMIAETRETRDRIWSNSYHPTKYFTRTKIIADGGIRDYDDIIKALCLGADYVMIGGLFASFKESCGRKYALLDDGSKFWLSDSDIKLWNQSDDVNFTFTLPFDKQSANTSFPVYTDFYGMASESGQMAINGKITKAAEGISKSKLVKFDIKKWIEEFKASLQSAMSYLNCKILEDLYGKSSVFIISPNTYHSINRF